MHTSSKIAGPQLGKESTLEGAPPQHGVEMTAGMTMAAGQRCVVWVVLQAALWLAITCPP